MKKHYFAPIVMFFCTAQIVAQTLTQPELNFSHACISDTFKNFDVGFAFTDKPFDADNIFYIELSDPNGDFSKADTLATVKDKNFAFEFTLSLELSQELAGSAYAIRVRSTAPAMISDPSAAFNAYYVPSGQLVLNNYEASSFCGAEPTLLELNVDVAGKYIWFKDGQVFTETEAPYLEVNQAGSYYAEPYFGACSGSLISNIVKVEALETMNVVLGTAKEVQTCVGTEVELFAENDDPAYSYQWYKDGNPVSERTSGTSGYTFAATEDTFGNYTLEVSNEFGCSVWSDTVKVAGSQIALVETAPLKSVILGDAVVELKFEVSRNGLEVIWYKDTVEIARGVDMLSYTAGEEGKYYAVINDPAACTTEIATEEFEVYEPEVFTVQTGFTSAYAACESTMTTLGLQGLTGHLSNGDEIDITPELYNNFEFSWLKDEAVTGYTTPEIALNDYTFSGTYVLSVTYKNTSFTSEKFDVYIGLPEVSLVQEEALTCNSPAVLRISALQDVIYNWYMNNELVHSGIENDFLAEAEGLYSVEVEYNGCVKTSEDLAVTSESSAMVSVFPGERITLMPGKDLEVYAEGADSYRWINASGEVLSESAVLNVSEEGSYILEAIAGGCVVEKVIAVYYDYANAIPNVVTPNNDTINDRWVLPGKLLEDPELEVIICDAYGQPVLKTRNYDNSWPQSLKEIPAQASNYYYILNKGDRNIQKGTITLIR